MDIIIQAVLWLFVLSVIIGKALIKWDAQLAKDEAERKRIQNAELAELTLTMMMRDAFNKKDMEEVDRLYKMREEISKTKTA